MKQFDKPYILLQNEEGIFYQMVKQSGVLNAQMLHKMAKISNENVYNKSYSMKPIPELKVGEHKIHEQ